MNRYFSTSAVHNPSLAPKVSNGLFAMATLLAAFFSAEFSLEAKPASDRPPNVVFVFCDDLGWGDLACFGHPDVKTPHVDRLAAEGLRLGQFYVSSPVCSPSRAGLVTGRFPAELGLHYAMGGKAGENYNSRRWLDPELPTIYDIFSRAGYVTGHYGKWHMGEGERGKNEAPPPSAYGIEESATTHSTGPKLRDKDHELTNANKSDVIAKRAVAFIQRHADRPFFLMLAFMDPHAVLDPTEEQMAPYLEHTHSQVRDRYRSSQTVYYAIISAIDAAVGRIIEELERQGILDETIIVFSSDNGPSPLWSSGTGHAGAGLAGPFRGVKGSLYEGGIRVPFVVRWPGRVPAGHLDMTSPVAATDMAVTLASLCGIDAVDLTKSMDGEDRSSIILGQPGPRQKPLFWEYRFSNWGRDIDSSPRLAVLDGEWKLLMNPDRSRVELYHLPEDMSETRDVAAYEKDRAENMSSAVLDWYKKRVMEPEKAPPYAGQKRWLVPVNGTIKTPKGTDASSAGDTP